ncbi:amidohydrolase [Ectothiorhodospiraceae bacterium WFHF3C12]|nr:amidohydrolase [Ectothiorhodospiraceae bacterium WFHF3C12]
MPDLKLALVQTPLHWHDPAANRDLLEQRLGAVAADVDLVVLPEMFNTGFTMAPEAHAEPHDGASVLWMQAMARRLGAVITGSLAVTEGSGHFNRLHWATPGGELLTYDKRHLFRMAGEQHHYQAGTRRLVAAIGDWRICPLVCYDLRFPVWSRNQQDYDLLIYVANWPAARRERWRRLLQARAIENLCYVVGVNRVGIDGNGVEYSGGSVALDTLGDTLADCGDAEGVTTVTLDHAALVAYRERFPAHLDADRFTLGP